MGEKGIPLTVEVGPRDLENGTVYVGRRDLGSKRESMERSQSNRFCFLNFG